MDGGSAEHAGAIILPSMYARMPHPSALASCVALPPASMQSCGIRSRKTTPNSSHTMYEKVNGTAVNGYSFFNFIRNGVYQQITAKVDIAFDWYKLKHSF
jgi:hypothetical protein